MEATSSSSSATAEGEETKEVVPTKESVVAEEGKEKEVAPPVEESASSSCPEAASQEAPTPPWERLKRKGTPEGAPSPRQQQEQPVSAHPVAPCPASELERTDVFEITSGVSTNLTFHPWTADNKPKIVPTHEPARMREGLFCESTVVDELWQQKTRMDQLFDRRLGRVYHRVRGRIFPTTISGSANVGISNRAGDKLWEVLDALDVWPSLLRLVRSEGGGQDGEEAEMKIRYVDVCGGPGAFSELVKNLGERENVKTIGKGMSLKIDAAQSKEASCIWYQHLLDSEDFDAVWGPDGDGNVYSPSNLTALEESVMKMDGRGAHLVMGDGAFEGGFLVCKLFDTFSTITASIIYVTTRLFEKCYIVKPQRSRVVRTSQLVLLFMNPSR
ncbi:hypothetical protein Pmar_PMAR003269 [Perkinsus marinus ATCC 50983]|uniref:Cap-specific mRNA (nucleoside-2'-O-)-methyltransferase 1 n=1 Tax=Perkinsus marinus (strain ATCC 50983 / TXsc) TaxID=423536 RepID=C5L5Q1_PERM5|nr:hypothetical protein Pmar_PMAR003269 [Perkinsus marinus ATCC 50983]EER07948.1 hypothetical protein Pmar_PMAR003269 [Perkinsus marinus ATCC 50983]|eukprot:XP_002776132.1 hypothetical protein Pmar_PMAR003269 [Perkinsus marinus ATCC 50983]